MSEATTRSVKPRPGHPGLPVRPPATTLAARAYEDLRDRLILLEIPPGTALSEAALQDDLGMGRTPIREALKRLELDHLVESFPRRGTFATRVDITDLTALSEVRDTMEPLAAGLAAANHSPRVRAELASLLETLTPEAFGWDRTDAMRIDLAIHRAVYRATGNPYLEETLVRLDALATRIWMVVLDRLPDVTSNVLEHRALLEAVLDGDADRARRLTASHIRDFEALIRAAL